MSSSEEQVYKRMQVKVLYSFNNNATVFLSRSKAQYSLKTIQIPIQSSNDQQEEMISLGAFDLKSCAQQILKSSPENFKLLTEDYAVYYKDLTEQPDEPFVANGVLSDLISSSKSYLIPGRVCQNLSASYLFGDKSNTSSLTLEIRLKLHTIEKAYQHHSQQVNQSQSSKRTNEVSVNYSQKRQKDKASSSSNAAVKATRTKSLPIFYNPHNPQIFNIINADKSNAPSKYDSKSVQDRFKSAPFLQAKVIDYPQRRNKNYSEPQRAMRTRSMVNQTPLIASSPINEEMMSDATDATEDTEYRDNNPPIDEEDEDDGDFDELSPYTPQQPPYKASNNNSTNNTFQSLPDLEDLDSKKTHTISHTKLPKSHGLVCTNSNCATSSSITWRYFETGFHLNHLAIHRAKEFDKKHYEGMFGPLCNACYLFLRNKGFMRPEGVVKKYLQQQKYKKELKQREEENNNIIINDTNNASNTNHDNYNNDTSSSNNELVKPRSNSLNNIALRKSHQLASSPTVSQSHKFATPSHTPSAINQVIQNHANNHQSNSKLTPNYNDLNDFMDQLNTFGGPLTDIDPLLQDQGITPPMMATKSNTRIINLYDDGENKENCPPSEVYQHSSPSKDDLIEFEKMMVKSFGNGSNKSSPVDQNGWIDDLFGEPTPRDQITPNDSKTPNDVRNNNDDTESEKGENKIHPSLPQLRTFTTNRSSSPAHSLSNKKAMVVNMPSSPLLTVHPNTEEREPFLNSEQNQRPDVTYADDEIENPAPNNRALFNQNSSPDAKRASRTDTTNSVMSSNTSNNTGKNNNHSSTPNTDFYSNDDIIDK